MAAVEIVDLSKSYRRDRKALDRVSLSVQPGEMVALIGASGSGKSTLLRHVAGLVAGDRDGGGGVTVLDRPIQQGGRINRHARRSRADIGFVFQQFNLVGRLSVLTNVLLGFLGRIPSWRSALGLFSHDEKLCAMEALGRVGIPQCALQRASTLSGGEQQRAAIARTLVQRAQILLADEPIASLDPASSRRIMEILARINREDGITVLVSLHQVDYALHFCRRTVAMRDGRIAYDGPSAALTPDFLGELYCCDGEDIGLAPRSAAAAAALETARPVRALG